MNVSKPSAVRTGLAKADYQGPRLLRTINGSASIPQYTMPSKAVSKPSSVSKKVQEEDINRLPESSSDEESPPPIKTSTFVRGCEKPTWQIKKEASKAALKTKVDKIIAKNNAARTTRDKGSQSTPTSSQSSDSSKRKSQDEEVVLPKYGAGMADEFKCVRVKKSKKLVGYSKATSGREPSSAFIKPDQMAFSDAEDIPPKFIIPGLLDTPPKSKPDAGSSFKTVDSSLFDSPIATLKSPGCKARTISNSPAEEPCTREPKFIMPEMDFDDSFDMLARHPRSSLPPIPKDTGGSPVAEDVPHATQKVFKSYDFDFDNSNVLETAQKVLEKDGSQRPISYAPATVLDDDSFEIINSEAHCPMCGDPVDQNDLRQQGPMNTRMQERFCRSHRVKTAKDEWRIKGYPNIDWLRLDSRISKHHAFIKQLISGEDSYYRDVLSEKVKSGKDRSLKTMTSNLIPGYYGARGLKMMSENIMLNFTPLLRKRIVKDRLMSARGFTPYVQSVLVPELAVLLIMEDMDVDIEEARNILANSAGTGELLNEEIREVVKRRIDDSEESDCEFQDD